MSQLVMKFVTPSPIIAPAALPQRSNGGVRYSIGRKFVQYFSMRAHTHKHTHTHTHTQTHTLYTLKYSNSVFCGFQLDLLQCQVMVLTLNLSSSIQQIEIIMKNYKSGCDVVRTHLPFSSACKRVISFLCLNSASYSIVAISEA